jgi:CspA family cold shock protein
MDDEEHRQEPTPPRWLEPALRAALEETERFDELCRILSLDPSSDFRFADLSGVNFGGSDLDGFDFTAACLVGCSFKGARIAGCIFDDAELGHASLPPASFADLTYAMDYEAFSASYLVLPNKGTDTSHRRTGGVYFIAPGVLHKPHEYAEMLRSLRDGMEVVETRGTVKWFDASKGYGFIAPDNGMTDILLHVTCLRAGGFHTAYEGTRVHCQAARRPRGLQAFRIISLDDSAANTTPRSTFPKVNVVAESDWERATVKWFNRVRGFGFLDLGSGQPDIFVDMETLRNFGFTELTAGETIQVRWGMGYKGCMAAELRADT